MKILYTYLFIFLYIGALLRPIVPVIDYNLNYDYIAKILCINKDEPELKCNGKCQLAKEIKKTIPINDQNEQPALPVIDFDKFPITCLKIVDQKFRLLENSKKLNPFSCKIGNTNDFITSVFQPPDFLV